MHYHFMLIIYAGESGDIVVSDTQFATRVREDDK